MSGLILLLVGTLIVMRVLDTIDKSIDKKYSNNTNKNTYNGMDYKTKRKA
jgi:hypothetical protein